MNCRFNNITSACFKHAVKNRSKAARSVSGATTIADFQDIPAVKGLPIIGTTLSLIAAGSAPQLHNYVHKRHQELGSIFKENVGPISCIFISDPEWMRAVFNQEGKHPMHVLPPAWTLYNEKYSCSRGLFFMDGEKWLHHRRILNRLLLKGDPKWIEDACNAVNKHLINHMKDASRKHDVFPNLETELYRWSIKVLVAMLMGVEKYEKCKDSLDNLLDYIASIVSEIFNTSSKLQLLPVNLAARFNIAPWKNFVKTVNEALLKSEELIHMLLEQVPENSGLLYKLLQEDIDHDEMIKIIADLVIAAGDTTTYSMEWMLYLVSKHPDVQEKLREQINTSGSSLMLKNVLRESLRLYPVAPFLTRIMPQGAKINMYNLPPGSVVILSVYTSGRDPKYFKNPEAFCPDRWIRNGINNTSIMQQASLPFSFGTRSCIGRKIAETQLLTTLKEIVHNFDVRLQNKEDVNMILKMVGVPDKPINLKLTPV